MINISLIASVGFRLNAASDYANEPYKSGKVGYDYEKIGPLRKNKYHMIFYFQ